MAFLSLKRIHDEWGVKRKTVWDLKPSEKNEQGMVMLAPMEGVVDASMRRLLTEVGGVDYCTTEFVRVLSRPLPSHVFYRLAPELRHGGKTASGVPVLVQLLGSDPDAMAKNARIAVSLGALGVDLNFGCPAKSVNRNDGGSILLKTPTRLYRVVRAVREAVDPHLPVTVKIRLGYEDKSLAVENALAAQSAGAHWLTVHGRTKVEGYKPPAHWDEILKIRQALSIEVIANGDIWNVADYHRCREVSGCQHVMLGRGLVSQPDLALQIKRSIHCPKEQPMGWEAVLNMVNQLACDHAARFTPYAAIGRIKQWLKMLSKNYPQSTELFEQIKREVELTRVLAHLK